MEQSHQGGCGRLMGGGEEEDPAGVGGSGEGKRMRDGTVAMSLAKLWLGHAGFRMGLVVWQFTHCFTKVLCKTPPLWN